MRRRVGAAAEGGIGLVSIPTLAEVLEGNPALPAPARRSFEQPWQATVFALTVLLHERGVITWSQWGRALGARLPGVVPDSGYEATDYFEAWAAALIDLLEQTAVVPPGEIERTQARWHEAAAHTPHGQPMAM